MKCWNDINLLEYKAILIMIGFYYSKSISASSSHLTQSTVWLLRINFSVASLWDDVEFIDRVKFGRRKSRRFTGRLQGATATVHRRQLTLIESSTRCRHKHNNKFLYLMYASWLMNYYYYYWKRALKLCSLSSSSFFIRGCEVRL